jgi:hypothetical protein
MPAAVTAAPVSDQGLALLAQQLELEPGRWQARRADSSPVPADAAWSGWLRRLQQAVNGAAAAAASVDPSMPQPSTPTLQPADWSIELLRDGQLQHRISATASGLSWTPATDSARRWPLPPGGMTRLAPPAEGTPGR